MAVRSRTEEFLHFRSLRAPRERSDDEELLISTLRSTRVEKPRWVQLFDEMHAMQRAIVEELNRLEQMHKERLNVRLAIDRDTAREEADIHRQAQSIEAKFTQAEELIAVLDAAFRREVPNVDASNANLSLLRNVKIALATEMAGLNAQLKSTQQRFIKNLERQKMSADKWAGGEARKELEAAIRRDAEAEGLQAQGCSAEHLASVRLAEQHSQETLQDVSRMVEALTVLHEMTADLKCMVIEQGTVLDRIDYNMTMVHTRVQETRKELNKAQELQKAGTFKICVLFLVILIILVLLVLVAKVIL